MNSEPFIWEVGNSPYDAEFLAGTQEFGQVDPAYLIDQYTGKRPAIINTEFLSKGCLDLRLYPSALLDSNVVDALDKRVIKGASSDGIELFLRFVTEKGWDFSPMFYYLEHYAKSPSATFVPNAIRRTESILTLHSMDEEHFLRTGEIKSNDAAVDFYMQSEGVSSISEVAESRVDSFVRKHDKRALNNVIGASQIAIIKMVLIEKAEMPRSSIADKAAEMERFMRDDLGVILAREAHFALHYFCGLAGRMLGIQANTSFQKALRTVKSTAWDLYLLRMPEILFCDGESEIPVAYVTTHEKRLQELARLFTIERIVRVPGGGLAPLVSYELSGIPQGVVSELGESYIEPSGGAEKKQIPVGLLPALENELQRFCS